MLLIALALGASRFGYVGDRVHGFLSPESDRRGTGFEVLALARAKANGAAGAAGLGHGSRAPPPLVARERLRLRRRGRGAGPARRRGPWSAAWVAIAAGAALATRSARTAIPRLRGVAAGVRGGAAGARRAAHRRLPRLDADHRRHHAVPQLRPGADRRLGRRDRRAGRDRPRTRAEPPRPTRADATAVAAAIARPICASSSSRARGASGARPWRRRWRGRPPPPGSACCSPPRAATDRLGRLFGRREPLGPTITRWRPASTASTSRPRARCTNTASRCCAPSWSRAPLFENRAVRGLLGAIPGLDAYALLGKAWWHTTEMRGRPPALRPGRISTGPRAATPR